MPGGFWTWLGGFVVLKISGGGQERFLNLALQRGIEVWDTRWQAEDILTAKVMRRDLRELKKIAKICGCSLNGGKGFGLPFTMRYFMKRKAFVAGVVVFAVGLLAASQLVWCVNVLPQEELHMLELEEVKKRAAALGVRPGAIFFRLDTDEIAGELLAEIDELSWVYIERQGTVVNIKVAERSIYPDELENATKGAIVANRDALIEDVLIKHGLAVAEHGDTVQVGEVLVEPLADGRADAIIHARVWYSGYGEGSLYNEESSLPTDEGAVYSLERADGGELLLWGQKPKPREQGEDEKLVVSSEDYQLGFWGTNFLLSRKVWQNEPVSIKEISESEAKGAAYQAALAVIYAQQNTNSRLLNEKVSYELLDGAWGCEVEWECMEEIGINRN